MKRKTQISYNPVLVWPDILSVSFSFIVNLPEMDLSKTMWSTSWTGIMLYVKYAKLVEYHIYSFAECIASRKDRFYIWHCVPNILLWSILCKTVGLPSSTGESERTARRQFHSPTLRCFRGRLCEVAARRGPLKQSWWPESNWTLPLRSVGVAPSLGRFWLVFTALKLRYVLRWHIILSDSYGKQEVLNCFTVYPGLGSSAK